MKIIDTHAHYDDAAYTPDRTTILSEIHQNGVTHIVNCASSYPSLHTTLELTREKTFVYAALGIHPSDGRDYNDEVEAELQELLKGDKVVAVGEIGLDYYWPENPPRDWQKEILLRQFDLARVAQNLLYCMFGMPMGICWISCAPIMTWRVYCIAFPVRRKLPKRQSVSVST